LVSPWTSLYFFKSSYLSSHCLSFSFFWPAMRWAWDPNHSG
jgi:hypothetical protein